MELKELKKLVIDEFGGDTAQQTYSKKAEEGFWISESYFINNYFTNKKGKILDLGCGTGRTTMPLVKIGYDVVAVDIVPQMIENARKIASQHGLKIDYRVGDATKLDFPDNYFDYLLFSNQGWTQIPGRGERMRALQEMKRVLKQGGICIFTAHPRVWAKEFLFFWIWAWIRFYILKNIGFNIFEMDFGDRFFTRHADVTEKQYIHIPSPEKVKEDIKKVGLRLLEANGSLQVSEKDIRKYPAIFFICKK